MQTMCGVMPASKEGSHANAVAWIYRATTTPTVAIEYLKQIHEALPGDHEVMQALAKACALTHDHETGAAVALQLCRGTKSVSLVPWHDMVVPPSPQLQ
jgi:hypothetical protein